MKLVAIAGVTIAVLIALAIREAWICDDALISFRYVDHLVAGHGLVFNLGERVEAFSSPAFLALLVPFAAFGADLGIVAGALGIAATVGELVLVIWILHRKSVPLGAIAIAAALFATDRIVAVWATGGLETAFHGALVTALLAMQLLRPTAIARIALLHVAVIASRPEGVVFLAIWIGHLMIAKRWADLRRAANVIVPAIAILLAARVLYYGELVANPYRAKLAGVPTIAIGFEYGLRFARRIGLYWVPLVVLARGDRKIVWLALGFVAIQLVAMVAMGGDYMCDFRFGRPILGAWYVAIGCAIGIAWQRSPKVTIAATLAFVAGHAYRQLDPIPIAPGAGEPSTHKAVLTIDRDRPLVFAAALARFTEPSDAIVADWAGYMAYGHDLRTVDATGLVSTHIARDFYLRDERIPGHARWPTIEMMQREHFALIFPKVNARPPEDPEVTAAMPRRTRDYPFLHVTVPLDDGRYLRFFTTFDAAQLAARASEKRITLCYRPAFGALTCVGEAPAR